MEIVWKINIVKPNADPCGKLTSCHTDELDDPIIRYQLEFLAKLGYPRNRKLRNFRKYFTDRSSDQSSNLNFISSFVDGYWEDEAGQVLTHAQVLNRKFGIPEKSLRLVRTEPHWIEFQIALANGNVLFGTTKPQLTAEQQFSLRHFVNDVSELANSAFFRKPSFFISGFADGPQKLVTTGVEHVAHFIAVFRRVYANGEKGDWRKVCNLIHLTLADSPFGKWLVGERQQLNRLLQAKVKTWPFNKNELSFNNSQLLSNFIYGKYLHQPNADDEKDRASWAIEAGNADLLEATFYATAMEVATALVNWSVWLRQLCSFCGIDLTIDSLGSAIPQIHHQSNHPEDSLSDDQHKAFEDCAAELAFSLRMKTAERTDLPSAAEFLDEARKHLRVVL